MALNPGTRIGPYEVIGPLGEGGMGEVLLAEDTRLHRRVALKRLTRGALHGAEERARVLREARAVARLQHPGITSVFDVVEDAGMVVIVMEFVEGETLAARLAKGRLDVNQAMDIGTQLADALAEAHTQGVLHCDLKPANVIITTAGRAKILDFGLAQLTASATASEDTRLVTSHTGASGVSGTAGYMAPERLTGLAPDERSDIYSLGIMMFEMLTGRRPFVGLDLVSVAATALTTQPPSPSSINPAIPEDISAVVLRAMARDPAERYASIADFAAALRRPLTPARSHSTPSAHQAMPERRAMPMAGVLIAGLVFIIAAAAIGITGWRPWRADGSSGQAPAVAIKPFANLGRDAANDPLGLGITDDLTTRLGALPNVAVVSRSTTAAYLAKSPDSPTLARDLGASFVIKGGFERTGDQLRVRVTLESADGNIVWTKDYAKPLPELFALQRAVAEDLAGSLKLSLSRKDRSLLATESTRSVEALADYSQGRQFLDRKDVKGNVDHAIELFDRAVGRDASFALAHASLGSAYWEKFNETKDAAWTARAIAASLEALRLNPNLAEAQIALGTAYRGLGQTQTAIDALGKALVLQPNNDDAHRLLGDVLADQGRLDDALREYQQAITIRPNYFQNYNKLAVALMKAGRYAEATSAFRRVTELQPDSAVGFNNLGVVAMMQDDLALALTSLTRAAEITPKASSFSNIGTIHFWSGRYVNARKAYEQALALTPADATLERNLGDALGGMEDRAAANAAYARALGLLNGQLKVNPKDASNLSLVAVLEAKLARRADARQHADTALSLAAKDPNVYYRSAVVAALAGQSDRALADLKIAVADGYSVNLIRHDLDLKSLQHAPDFVTLLKPQTR